MENPFSKLLDFRKLGLFKKNDSVIGVDFGSSSAKVVQVRNDKGRVILETYGELATGPYSNMSVGQAAILPNEKQIEVLKDLFKEANITTTEGAMGVALRSSLLLTIELPDMPKADLARVVPIEARKYIPVPISEVALDWWIIPKERGDKVVTTTNPDKPDAGEMIEILVVAIHKDMIKVHETVSKGAGLVPSFFEIETFSAIRSAMHSDLSPHVMVDLGAASTKVAVVDYGIVRTSHTINKGAQDITMAISRSLGVSFTKAEEIKRRVGLVERVAEGEIAASVEPVVEYIFSELNKVVLNYQKKHSRSVDNITLIGGGALLQGITPVAEHALNLPVTLGAPFNKVESPAFLAPVLAEAGPGFAVAIGLALRVLQER
jgi:type IV pilus assembly protein PilM